jgi:hypothetical protein
VSELRRAQPAENAGAGPPARMRRIAPNPARP